MFPPKLRLLLCFLACAPLCVGQFWTRIGNPQNFSPYMISSRNTTTIAYSSTDFQMYYLNMTDGSWRNVTIPNPIIQHLFCVLNDGTIITGDLDNVMYTPSLEVAILGNWTFIDYYDAACAGLTIEYFVMPDYYGDVQIIADMNWIFPGPVALDGAKALGLATDGVSMCMIGTDNALWCGPNANFVQMPTGRNLYGLDYFDVNNLILCDTDMFVWYYNGNADWRLENIPGQAIDVEIVNSTLMIVTPDGQLLQWPYVPVGNATVPAGTTTLQRIGFTYYIFTTTLSRANAELSCAQYNSRVAHLITPGEVTFLSAAISSPVYVNSYKTTFNYGPSNCFTLSPGASTVTTGASCSVALGYICKVRGI